MVISKQKKELMMREHDIVYYSCLLISLLLLSLSLSLSFSVSRPPTPIKQTTNNPLSQILLLLFIFFLSILERRLLVRILQPPRLLRRPSSDSDGPRDCQRLTPPEREVVEIAGMGTTREVALVVRAVGEVERTKAVIGTLCSTSTKSEEIWDHTTR